MNGPAAQLLTSAAVFRGELGKMLLAGGVVLLILFVGWAVEEWRATQDRGHHGMAGSLLSFPGRRRSLRAHHRGPAMRRILLTGVAVGVGAVRIKSPVS